MEPTKPAYHIVSHKSLGAACFGCIVVVPRGSRADLVCNECAKVVRTVPLAEAELELMQMTVLRGLCSAVCEHCGIQRMFSGLTSSEAFICPGCGQDNSVTTLAR